MKDEREMVGLRGDDAPAVDPTLRDGEICDGEGAVATPFPGERLQGLRIGKGNQLPHWTVDHAVYHVCFRLADSVPAEKLAEWEAERKCFSERQKAGIALSDDDIARMRYVYSENVERYLDSGHGSCLLRSDGALAIVLDTLRHDDGAAYRLHAYGIMPNHVHVGVEPFKDASLSEIVQTWKSVSAHRINRKLGRKGELWQSDYYNHVIRTAREYAFQMKYIAGNDVLRSWRMNGSGDRSKIAEGRALAVATQGNDDGGVVATQGNDGGGAVATQGVVATQEDA